MYSELSSIEEALRKAVGKKQNSWAQRPAQKPWVSATGPIYPGDNEPNTEPNTPVAAATGICPTALGSSDSGLRINQRQTQWQAASWRAPHFTQNLMIN